MGIMIDAFHFSGNSSLFQIARTTWDIVRTVINNSRSNHAINPDGKLCSNNQIIATTFNDYCI
jgi:hypothetical protein